ncbi:serine/threonine-protein kinase fray2-like [Argopecten irradians]|uniref:serine/threonine-protein kinase fray2-like n=2 Tax=Argopecten irradians TaxID=31199 RepID=UPI003718F7FE
MANSIGVSYVEPTHNVESGDDRDTGLDPDSRRAGVRGRCRVRETRHSSPMSQPRGRKRDRHYGDRSSLSDDRGKVRSSRYDRFKCSRSPSHSRDVSDRSRSRSKDRSVSRGPSGGESSYSYTRHSSEDESSKSSISSRRSSSLSPPRKRKKAKRNSSDSRSNYVRFEVADTESEKPELPSDMANYVMNKFTSFIPEKILMDKILDKYPVPKNISVGAHKVDSYVPEIFQSVNRSYGKAYDQNLSSIQTRVGSVMGPLSKLWVDIDGVRSGETDKKLDLFSCLELVEKTITLVGQAFNATTYHRRMNILYNLTKDVKKSKHLLKENSDRLTSDSKIFGKKFYKALVKSSAISRESREISKELAAKSKSSLDRSRSTNTQRDQAKPYNKPFQKKAPFRGGGSGGRSNSFRGRRGAQKSYKGGKSAGDV